MRLQAIGFSDWRRSLGLYYELAREARAELVKYSDGGDVWRRRLKDLGVRVGSALVEMGDLKAAARHLEGLREGGEEGVLCLLYVRMGNLAAAKRCLGERGDVVVRALFLMAEGRWEEGVDAWKGVEGEMARCNLAVCLLYTGRLEEVGSLVWREREGVKGNREMLTDTRHV